MELFVAVSCDDVDAFTRLVECDPGLLWSRDPHGYGNTVLHEAARCGSMHVLHEILGTELDVGLRNRFGATSLQVAAASGRLEALSFLLASGCPLEGALAAGCGVQGGHECLRALLAAGSDPNQERALHHLVQAGCFEPGVFEFGAVDLSAIRLMLEHGADPQKRDEKGRTPADIAFAEGNCVCTHCAPQELQRELLALLRPEGEPRPNGPSQHGIILYLDLGGKQTTSG